MMNRSQKLLGGSKQRGFVSHRLSEVCQRLPNGFIVVNHCNDRNAGRINHELSHWVPAVSSASVAICNIVRLFFVGVCHLCKQNTAIMRSGQPVLWGNES